MNGTRATTTNVTKKAAAAAKPKNAPARVVAKPAPLPPVRTASPASIAAQTVAAARAAKPSPPVMSLAEAGRATTAPGGREAAGGRAAPGGPGGRGAPQIAPTGGGPGGGAPLAPDVRGPVERSFGADFGAVRVHTDGRAAAAASAVSARAFTHGTNVFLGPGERPNDLGLLAHEAAHVVQQRGAPRVQRLAPGQHTDACEGEAHRAASAVLSGQPFEVRERTGGERVQRLGLSDALNYFADAANAIPGFRMFTIVLGVNPINMSSVDRSAANILRAIVEFIPGGNLITRALDTYGVFEKVGGWIDSQIRSLGLSPASIKQAIDEFLDSLSWSDIFDLGGVWERAKRIFTGPIDQLINFAKGLITGILGFLREAVLRPLAALAEGTPAYDLLKAVLGKDPITGDPVPQDADALIGGFMKLIGQEEVYNNIKKGNAIGKAGAWFMSAITELLGFVRQIPGMIISLLESITIQDFLPITNLFGKVGKTFGGFFGSFVSWAGGKVLGLLQIIFEVVAPGAVPYIQKAAGAFKKIIENPIAFVGNLVRAGIQGFNQFAGNFLSHLRKSLIEWLTGTMSGAGVYIPQAFSLQEIIKFVLSVLGLTWQDIRIELVKALGEPAVKVLETTFDVVMTLVKEGPAAAWDKIKEAVSNLKEMVMGQVMSFVRDRVVQAAITKLVTSLNPAGAFIQAIIATYNTIMFFVERLQQIMRVVTAFIDSISAIAAGNIGTAASRVETTMGGMLTLLISFLARIAGLGKVSDAVKNIVNAVRAPIKRGIAFVVNFIKSKLKALGGMVKGKDARSPEEKKRDLDRAVRELTPRIQPMLAKGTKGVLFRAKLLLWKRQYKLTDLSVAGGKVRAAINPTVDMFSVDEINLGAALEPILKEAERLHLESIKRNRREHLQDAQARARAGGSLTRRDVTPDEMVIILRREKLRKERATIRRGNVDITLANRRRKVERAGAYAARHLPGMRDKKRRWGYGNWPWSVNRQLEEGVGDTFETRVLREEVEVARGKGNLPAARIGSALVAASEESGIDLRVEADVTGRSPAVRGATNLVTRDEITVGRMAPMATGSSAVAAGSGEVPTRKPSKKQLEDATKVRHGSYAVIFNTLSAAARRRGDPLLKLPGRQGEALEAVAQAFNQWKAIVSPDPAKLAGTPAAMAAAQTLQGAIQRFLAAMDK